MADFEYGVTCIVSTVQSSKKVNLNIVLSKKQYSVVYNERKFRYDDRILTKLLAVGDAVKASAWNVPSGPPGSNNFSWYVTDIWTPNIAGMVEKRLPEPTFSIVCRVVFTLGKAHLVCEVGKFFPRNPIVLPRSAVDCVVENAQPGVGDYLLVSILLIWEQQGNKERPRLIPIWAHWSKSNDIKSTIPHLNAIESGPENEDFEIQDQIPCMWGVVQKLCAKSFLVYVSCIEMPVTVFYTAVHQYNRASMIIVEGDWVQLWLRPKVFGKVPKHISEVKFWSCSLCYWFGSRGEKTYERFLQDRLTSRYHRSGSFASSETKPNKIQAQNDLIPFNDIVGIGKITLVKDGSAFMKCDDELCRKDHVIPLGMFTVYGIKVSNVKKCRMKDIVERGSEVHYRMDEATMNVRAAWIGPEVVPLDNLNFMPQLITWMKNRHLDGEIIREMMKELTDRVDALYNAKSTDPCVASQTIMTKNSPQEEKIEIDVNKSIEAVQSCSTGIDQSNGDLDGSIILEEEEKLLDEAISLAFPGNSEVQPSDDASDFDLRYSKEEEEELEKLWWSDDSDEESDGELRPVLKVTSLDEAPKPEVSVEDSQMSGTTVGVSAPVPLSSKEESTQDNRSENGLSKLNSVGNGIGIEEETSSGSGSVSDFKSNISMSNLTEESVNGNCTRHGSKNMAVAKPKDENTKKASCLLVMSELTKFLLMKGKVLSVAEAGELSANFVSHLESVVEESHPPITATQSVGTQTEISGPMKSEL